MCIVDIHITGSLNMNPVSIRACSRSLYAQESKLHSNTSHHSDMSLGTVDEVHVVHTKIVTPIEFEHLYIHAHLITTWHAETIETLICTHKLNKQKAYYLPLVQAWHIPVEMLNHMNISLWEINGKNSLKLWYSPAFFHSNIANLALYNNVYFYVNLFLINFARNVPPGLPTSIYRTGAVNLQTVYALNIEPFWFIVFLPFIRTVRCNDWTW